MKINPVTAEILKDLTELAAIPSVKADPEPLAPFGREARRALDWFLKKGREYGLAVLDADGYAGHLELPAAAQGGKPIGAGGKLAGVLVHLDVVPARGEGWRTPPFCPTVASGRLVGRGVADDKGAAVVLLHVLKRLKAEGAALRNTVRLIAGCDEESGSACVKHYFEKRAMPDFGFSPDADFPLIFAEKHSVRLNLVFPMGAAFRAGVQGILGDFVGNIVPEYAAALLRNAKAGSAQSTVHSPQLKDGNNAQCNGHFSLSEPVKDCPSKERGHFSLSEPVKDCPSKENSPAKKEKSVGEVLSGCAEKDTAALPNSEKECHYECENSQSELLNSQFSILNSESVSFEKIEFHGRAAHSMECFKGDNALWKLCAELRKRFPDPALDFIADKICGETDGKKLGIARDDGVSGALTCNFSVMSYADGKLSLSLDARCPVNGKPEEIAGIVEKSLPEGAAAEAVINYGYALDKNDPLVRVLLGAYQTATGKRDGPKATGGGTYARYLKRGVAFGPMFDGTDYKIHAPGENLPIDEIGTLFDIYYRAVKGLGDL
ncbi:MAG: M20/M25/M40 family metallo-hydrolase [Clostridiales bacterium]|jgi:acetylornithine deacetylase/succinyl-diaminopimelate desuccinylase-like protein|nr:M20/M25/M40 family metallo-hydrolase [Clostridiales bacterium]